uniref:galactose-specific lectin nattectin-like n=1 Tax=Semicossyphus pulcher TaxID=241346 RepID=UPI0037E783AB
MAFTLHLIVLLGLSSGLWMGANARKKCYMKDCCKVCSEGWTEMNGRCYMFHFDEKDWCDAESHCTGKGGNLASLRQPNDADVLINYVVKLTGGKREGVWLGANNAVRDDCWKWSDGFNYNFKQWAQGEPNNFRGKEHCMAMSGNGNKRVNDLNCSRKLSFMCAKDLEIKM